MNARRLIFFALVASMALVACSAGPAATAAPAYRPTAAAMATAAPTTAPAGQSGGGQLAFKPPAQQMVIKDASIDIVVSAVDTAVSQVTQMAADQGGYIISSQTWYDADRKHASLHLAVPSAKFEAMLNQLRNLGVKVEAESTSGQDVSAEYTDLRSQLTNLEATAARVRAFLDEAKTVEDALRVNAELSRLEADIERIKGQMRYYEGRSAFSTITVTLRPEAAALEPTPTPAWDPAKTFERASNVLVRLSQRSVDALIWLFVIGGPILLAFAVLIGIVRWLDRKAAPKRGQAG